MIRSIGGAPSAASYEPVDAADYDDQNDDVEYRGRRPTAYQHLAARVEEEDEEEAEAYGQGLADDIDHVSYNHSSPSWANISDRPEPHFNGDNPLLRSVSREGSKLSHPTPDLQAIQGAYIGNVSRLEESAERLSMSEDMGEELRKLNDEIKRADSRRSSVRGGASRQFSSSSHTNSVLGLNSVARSGGFSHEGYVTSPISSMRSPAWSALDRQNSRDQVVMREPLQEGKPLDSPISVRSNILTVRNQDKDGSLHEESLHQDSLNEALEEHGRWSQYMDDPQFAVQEDDRSYIEGDETLQRNASTATKNTFQQAEQAFADFDGVHIHNDASPPLEDLAEEPQQEPIDRTVSFSPNFGGSVQSQDEPPPEEPPLSPPLPDDSMVFYPAPVPMMLNLPQKLSKNISTAKMAQRRSQFMMGDKRKSKMDLTGQREEIEMSEEAEAEKKIPPQLRATMYFDQPSVAHNIEVLGGSAVATLDSILDASAFAPVSAFTDHPIVGQVGPEVYGRTAVEPRKLDQRRSQSTTDILARDQQVQAESRKTFLGFTRRTKTQSNIPPIADLVKETDAAEDEGEEAALHANADDPNQAPEPSDFGAQHDEEVRTDRPTTLLAELQIRKQEQSKRNKTAATAFPDGMHSTLLQLDTVAQIQKQSRKQKQITLAWEDPAAAEEPEPDDTEDVPLGMLYPTRKLNPRNNKFDEDRPLGLLARRDMDDNEPLSSRRARLRGVPPPVTIARRQSSYNMAPSPEMGGEKSGGEDDNEGETLAQRKQRLAVKEAVPRPRPVSGDFASELLSQFGPGDGEEKKAAVPKTDETPDPEETLGQRRKRLQAEALAKQQSSSEVPTTSNVQKRRSMADLLSVHPVGQPAAAGNTGPTRGLLGNMNVRNSTVAPIRPNATKRNSSYTLAQSTMAGANLAPGYYSKAALQQGKQAPAFPAMQQQQQQQQQYNAAMMGGLAGGYVNPMTYAPMMNMQGTMGITPAYQQAAALDHTPLDTKQRDMIDRWRQSVL